MEKMFVFMKIYLWGNKQMIYMYWYNRKKYTLNALKITSSVYKYLNCKSAVYVNYGRGKHENV